MLFQVYHIMMSSTRMCYGKHVLPLWSLRSKWPILEISLISLTFGNIFAWILAVWRTIFHRGGRGRGHDHKECHGKHVLPLWSLRSKWPILEISLISLTFGNILPGYWLCGGQSSTAEDMSSAPVRRMSSTHVRRTSSACPPRVHLVPCLSKWFFRVKEQR